MTRGDFGLKNIELQPSDKFKMRFEKELAVFLGVFEPHTRRYFERKIKESAVYPSLIKGFYRDLGDFTTGGKRLRAFLVWLGYQVARGPVTHRILRILPICLAYELAHSFLLIHDDVIDQSQIRRGKPTIHQRYEKFFGSHYGASQAIVLGDIACFEAFGLVSSSEFTDSQKVVCQKKLIEILLETGYGEALDVEYSHQKPKLSAIWQMTQLKTAKYSFVGPLTLGAILAKATKGQIDALAKFGQKVGLAFQIQDDILGVFGDEKILGKSILSDLCEGKNTLLVYKAGELAKGQDKKDLDRLWGKKDAKMADLEKVRGIMTRSGAFEWCQMEKQRLVKSAKGYISKITDGHQIRELFGKIADFVIERES